MFPRRNEVSRRSCQRRGCKDRRIFCQLCSVCSFFHFGNLYRRKPRSGNSRYNEGSHFYHGRRRSRTGSRENCRWGLITNRATCLLRRNECRVSARYQPRGGRDNRLRCAFRRLLPFGVFTCHRHKGGGRRRCDRRVFSGGGPRSGTDRFLLRGSRVVRDLRCSNHKQRKRRSARGGATRIKRPRYVPHYVACRRRTACGDSDNGSDHGTRVCRFLRQGIRSRHRRRGGSASIHPCFSVNEVKGDQSRKGKEAHRGANCGMTRCSQLLRPLRGSNCGANGGRGCNGVQCWKDGF